MKSNYRLILDFMPTLSEQKVFDIRFIQLESNGHWASSRPLRNKLSLEEHFQIELQRSGTSHLTQEMAERPSTTRRFLYF